jgi:hypothetical protein
MMEAQDAAVWEELRRFKDKLLVMRGKGIPLKYLPNMEVISIEFLLGDKDTATIWRGP